jgi:hypothetical protein
MEIRKAMSTQMIDFRKANIVHPTDLTRRESKAVAMLLDEVAKRTRINLPVVTEWPGDDTPAIAIIPYRALSFVDPPLEIGSDSPEGYHVTVNADRSIVYVVGNDERGVLYGIGYVLRNLRMENNFLAYPKAAQISTAPAYGLRGHQIGYRDKVNSYDGWDLPQWEQYIRDLAVFGANAVEMIPPRSDDRETSVHFPRPPLEMMAGVSGIADEYGLDVWLWYPALDEDYSDPATVEFALDEWAEVFKALPRLDAILVPGGDPGRTPPKLLMPMLEKQAAQLEKIHPGVCWWVSPQGFTTEKMDLFLKILADESPDWLTGVCHGPWVHMDMSDFRELVPDRYPIRNYPDITHTLGCQFPVPDWDIAHAMTIGREPCNPRPLDQAAVFHKSQPDTIGFLAYCEGCHDDVNKSVWSGLGWNPETPVIDILREYGRYFVGLNHADDFAQGLLALERNWRGQLATNYGVVTTLLQFRAMEETVSPWTLKNWRFLQALYRAYYDAYVRSRLIYESSLQERAMEHLRCAVANGSLVAMNEAERILDLAVNERISMDLRTRIFQLAEALYQSVAHIQLSVHLYRGQAEVRGANLDGVDFPLNDRPWLKDRFASIRMVAEEADRLAEIKKIVNWTDPGPGGFYIDLGGSIDHPNVVEGPGYDKDPAYIQSPQHRFSYRKDPNPIRFSWRGYVGPIHENPLQMRFTGLEPGAQYRIRLVYSDLDPNVKVLLTSSEAEVHPWILKPVPRQPVEYDIPIDSVDNGTLTLSWQREKGMGHSGTGCEISELWIIKTTSGA